ncbi:MAG: ParB N-terminal domain-containing protein [Anaerolineae bacterium]|nr:ParB N-terminal domain-containing protein [Anaerolineae bacterium]
MSKKRYLEDNDPFSDFGKSMDGSAASIDAELFGALQKVDQNRQSASPVSIFDILPDPAQPRRAIPTVIRHQWDGTTDGMQDMFRAWVDAIRDERNSNFNLQLYLDANTDIERPEKVGPLESALLEIIELAVSIRDAGLTNPITVLPKGLQYSLETGERRWLAYHLLYVHTSDERFSKIAARTVDSLNLWRQAAENNARANLNAISKARQLAVLIMDLLAEKTGKSFKPFSAFEDEQDYYSQVADGNKFRTPPNTSERLLAATGLKHEKQVRDYRKLLRLPSLVWQLADDLNWTEYFIRNLVEKADSDPDKIIVAAVKAARKQGYTAPVGTVPDIEKPSKSKMQEEFAAPGTKQYYSQMTRLMAKIGPGKSDANSAALQRIREFRRWLDEQEMLVEQYLD